MDDRSDRFVASDVTAFKPQCHLCERYVWGTLTCVLFDKRIPQSILLNKVNHFVDNVPGDCGMKGRSTLGRPPVLQDLIETLATGQTPEAVARDWAKSFVSGLSQHG